MPNIDGYVYSNKDYLGGGRFGLVYKGKDAHGTRDVAIKKVRLPDPQFRDDDEFMKYITGERDALERVTHPHIVKLFHVKQETDFIFFITELCDSNLDSYFEDATSVSLDVRLQMMSEMASAVMYMHTMKPKPFLHRDIKPQNILLNDTGNGVVVKVADLGQSRQVDDGMSLVSATPCGTPNYKAPEMWPDSHGKVHYYTGVDIFALGILFQAILQASPKQYLKPLKGGEDGRIPLGHWMSIKMLQGKTVNPQVHVSVGDEKMNQQLVDLILRMLQQNPKQRIKCDAVEEELLFIKDIQLATAASRLPELEGAVGGLSLREDDDSQATAIPDVTPSKRSKSSPYVLKVSGAPDASKVRVSGPGVEHGILASYQNYFICETRGAGAGELAVMIKGDNSAHSEIWRGKDGPLMCLHEPKEGGAYVISVKWSGVDVPGSPFHIQIFDTKEELDRFMADNPARRQNAPVFFE